MDLGIETHAYIFSKVFERGAGTASYSCRERVCAIYQTELAIATGTLYGGIV